MRVSPTAPSRVASRTPVANLGPADRQAQLPWCAGPRTLQAARRGRGPMTSERRASAEEQLERMLGSDDDRLRLRDALKKVLDSSRQNVVAVLLDARLGKDKWLRTTDANTDHRQHLARMA